MANITGQNPIRYCIDKINTSSYGVIITKSGKVKLTAQAAGISGLYIQAVQPNGTDIKFLFRTDDKSDWFKLNASGESEYITSKTPYYEILSQTGNSVSELQALTNIPAFTGKKILMAVSLSTRDPDNAIPKMKLSVKAVSSSQVLTHTELSPFYELKNMGYISEIRREAETHGDGEVKLYAQITRTDGTSSDWIDYAKVKGMTGTQFRLKAEYSVKGLDTSSASLTSANIIYREGGYNVTGAASSEIVSWTQDWYMNVKQCRMSIRHNALTDSEIAAYVCFRDRPLNIQNEQLGIGTGSRTSYQLAYPDGLKYDTVKLFYDNQLITGEYDINCEVGRITCTAPEGVIIMASYESGWGEEDWQKMNLYSHDSHENYELSEYRYSRPENEYNNTQSVCAVKIVMTTSSGNIINETIGKGTGKTQTYKLTHIIKDGNISIYDNGTLMPRKSYTVSDDPQYVRIAGTSGHVLTASYEWISETPIIYQFAAVFAS
ncbi:MAG: hypothetical protein IJR43_07505 [Synergistaceae bacterium]|nr:hypothetical protein [Synergistaceae bacterium]